MNQRSLSSSFSLSGIGLHRGTQSIVECHPLPVNSGIVFSTPNTQPIRLQPDLLCHGALCTGIQLGLQKILTLEHLLAAVMGAGLDNLHIRVDGEEIPILDGSAAPWFRAFQKAGIVEQSAPKFFFSVPRTLSLQEGSSTVTMHPCDHLKIEFSIDFPHPKIGRMSYLYLHSPTTFSTISSARTFGFIEDRERLHAAGYALGASTENCLLFTKTDIYPSQHLRHPKEPVLHKILDFMGDLAVLNQALYGHFILHRSNHALNQRIVKLLSFPKIG